MSRSRSLLALLALVSCKEPTQITLELSTDGRCPGEDGAIALFRSLGIAAGEAISSEPAAFSATTSECVSSPTIGTLVLVPAAERAGDLVEVLVVASMERGDLLTPLEKCDAARVEKALEGTSCIVARRRLGFVDGLPLTLPIELEAACIGVTCEEDETCFGGVCVDSQVECGEQGCTKPGELGSGGSGAGGSGASGSGASGSGASGSGASGSGGSGSGSGGALASGSGGTGASGGVGGSGASGGVGGTGASGGAGGTGGTVSGQSSSNVGGAGGSTGPTPVMDCPPASPPPGEGCGTPACDTYCGMCGASCMSGPCTCFGVVPI